MSYDTPAEQGRPLREDTSMCNHLRQLLDIDATPVKLEPGLDPATGKADTALAKVEKRFIETVRWGAVAEGVKRRKVS
jgi:ubiquitin carboxyl-terminal hydrolase 22/27/51